MAGEKKEYILTGEHWQNDVLYPAGSRIEFTDAQANAFRDKIRSTDIIVPEGMKLVPDGGEKLPEMTQSEKGIISDGNGNKQEGRDPASPNSPGTKQEVKESAGPPKK